MQLRDLHLQYRKYKAEIDGAIQKVLDQANFIGGQEVDELEAQLAAYVNVKHCVACANGTEAMTLVLMSWGIQEGDAVFVPEFTFVPPARWSRSEAPRRFLLTWTGKCLISTR